MNLCTQNESFGAWHPTHFVNMFTKCKALSFGSMSVSFCAARQDVLQHGPPCDGEHRILITVCTWGSQFCNSLLKVLHTSLSVSLRLNVWSISSEVQSFLLTLSNIRYPKTVHFRMNTGLRTVWPLIYKVLKWFLDGNWFSSWRGGALRLGPIFDFKSGKAQ